MKTTVDISDALLARAKRHARRVGRPLRALAPLPEAMSWQDLRDEIYGYI